MLLATLLVFSVIQFHHRTNTLEDMFNIETIAINFVWAIAILAAGYYLSKFVQKFVRKVLTKREISFSIVNITSNTVFALLLLFTLIAVLTRLGFETTSMSAVLAALGLAIGLAFQSTLSHFASGILLLTLKPFKEGDFVEAASSMGTIESVGIFSTKLVTPDNKSVLVPNGNIVANTVTNFSAHDTRRIDLVIGVAYSSDLNQVKQILQQIITEESDILTDQENTIAVLELADSSINLAVRSWVNSADFWPVRFRLLETIKNRFDDAGIEIPFPQVTVNYASEAEANKK